MRYLLTLWLSVSIVSPAAAQRPTAARRAPILVFSSLYTGSALSGAYLAIRDSLPQAPFGIQTGRSPRADFFTGTGTALSPGLPLLLLQAGAVGLTAGQPRVARASIDALAVGGGLFAIGQLAEPVGRETLAHPSAMVSRTLVVVGNIVLPALMSVAAVRALR